MVNYKKREAEQANVYVDTIFYTKRHFQRGILAQIRHWTKDAFPASE